MQVLSIMRVRPGVETNELIPYSVVEAAKAWEHYAAGMLRTMHLMPNAQGVVFMWEAPDVETVNTAISGLPMIQKGLLDAEVIPLMNYTGIDQLFAKKRGS